jgi:hypothetical protein
MAAGGILNRTGESKSDLDTFMAAAGRRVEQLIIMDQAVETMHLGGSTKEVAGDVPRVSSLTIKAGGSAARAWRQSHLSRSPR